MARVLASIGVAAVLVTGGASGAGSDAGYVVIVNAANGITELDRDFVRDVYLRKATEWGNRAAVHPIDLGAAPPVRDQFVRDVIRKSPAQLRNYWNQQIFSGKGVPPPEAGSPASLIARVQADPGAIGYIPAGVDPGAARVIRIR